MKGPTSPAYFAKATKAEKGYEGQARFFGSADVGRSADGLPPPVEGLGLPRAGVAF